jgi:hypothetical protein
MRPRILTESNAPGLIVLPREEQAVKFRRKSIRVGRGAMHRGRR